MPVATVLIPTHSHAEPLPLAVESVKRQTIQDFELFLVGDGVTDETREVANRLASSDDRIRFFDLPKTGRKGEVHRHTVLQEARGRFVAYLGDDDLWMDMHLATLDEALREVDFAHTMHVGINRRGRFYAREADLEDANFRARILRKLFNRFDINVVGHTLDAYRRLPHGWRNTPDDFPWSDLYMWRQFLAEPWLTARSIMVPTAICTLTHLRPRMKGAARAAELERLLARFPDPSFREEIWRVAARDFAGRAITARRKIRSAP